MRQAAHEGNFWDEDLDMTYGADGFSPTASQSLVSVPASVRSHMSRYHEPIHQPQELTTQSAMNTAIVELARSAPHLAAPIIGAAFGVREIEETVIERYEGYERIQRRVLGFSRGDEIVPVTITKSTIKRQVVR